MIASMKTRDLLIALIIDCSLVSNDIYLFLFAFAIYIFNN